VTAIPLGVCNFMETMSNVESAAVAAFIIDNKLHHAATYSAIGAVLSWFGVIQAGELGFGMALGPALGYLLMAVVFLAMSRFTSHEANVATPEEI